jgi:tetratricopeptide (TPR) repeat protein
MNDPLLRLFYGNGRLSDSLFLSSTTNNNFGGETTPNFVSFGQQLYQALFSGSLRDSWIAAQGIAQNQRTVLRLRLGLKGNRLPRLPWEVLHAGGKNSYHAALRPLATGVDIAFSRYQFNRPLNKSFLRSALPKNQPLKILMVLAGPDDKESLELRKEAWHLQQELQQKSTRNLPGIKLQILENPGREELTQALEQGKYQVFHYAGHSNLGDSGGDVYLVSRTTGLTEILYGEDLAGLLANNGVQLAVFNSCHSADTAFAESEEVRRERNLAQALVARGIPAVLAMAARIPDQVALTLTRLLYRNLNLGYPIDFSLSRARQGLISAYGSNQLYWALPVLYLHPDFDGVLANQEHGVQSLTEEEPLALTVAEEEALAMLPVEIVSPVFLPEEEEELDESETEIVTSELLETKSVEKEDDSEDPDLIKSVLQNLETQPKPELPQPSAILAEPTPLKSKITVQPVAPTSVSGTVIGVVTSLAIAEFSQGNLQSGSVAIETLLEHNALTQAEIAIKSIPVEQLDEPRISFLRGRLAWQLLEKGSINYELFDTRRYWEMAARAQPNSVIYLNALGFAYYQEGKYERAEQIWNQAMTLIKKEYQIAFQELNTYAGLALVWRQLAQKQSFEQQNTLNMQALRLYQKVMTQDPINFQVDALRKNWLWTQTTINDWQSLMAANI